MKSRFFKTVLLAGFIVGGIWVLSNREKIHEPGDVVSLAKEQLSTATAGIASQVQYQSDSHSQSASQPLSTVQSPQYVTNVIRIASFKLNNRITRQQSDAAMALLAGICRRYDAVAFQDIGTNDTHWLDRLAERLNSVGATGAAGAADRAGGQATTQNQFDYSYVTDRLEAPRHPAQANPAQSAISQSAISQSAISQSAISQSAIVYNRRTLELDPSQVYTVNDPDEILSREPLVACFRTRGPAVDQAFTFSLVNIKIDSQRSERELAYLGELFRAIRDDGRGEDDVLIVGDFNAGDRELRPIAKQAGLTWVVSNRPTNTRNTSQDDNLIFNEAATVEFTGRGGVFDFMRHYNLRLDDALQISEHMPVWAEFSVFEGAAARTPRNQPPTVPRRVAEGDSSRQR